MNGLEQILRKIEEDSSSAVSEIMDDAAQRARLNDEEETGKANARASEITAKAKKTAEQIAENSVGSCEAALRKGELKAKSDVVAGWLADSMAKINSMSGEEYYSAVFNLAVSHCSRQNGILLMNKRDKANMPGGYMKMLNDALPEGASLELSDEDADIKNGFIIRYGGIEENCVFDSLLEEKTDVLKDKLFALIDS
ncbi:MAG: hypothetical protein IJT03_06270 [Clostridia bacterium]|nr:hypothetical protein [Clostridia bacterium]